MTHHEIILPFEMTNANDGRGRGWFNSAQYRKKAENKLRLLGMTRTPFDRQVTVHVTRIMGRGQRHWDSSSIGRGNWKEIEDALVACGWFVDDSVKYIRETRYYQDDSRRDMGPCIVMVIEQHQKLKLSKTKTKK